MKKIILLAVTALMMVGCQEQELMRRGDIVNIDSCQYVVGDAYGGYTYTHHGNCRFCKERDSIKWEKRKKEMKELVEQLKEK